MASIAKVTSKGQVTIPSEVRKALQIDEGDNLLFESSSKDSAVIRVIKQRRLEGFRGALSGKSVRLRKESLRDVIKEDLARKMIGRS